MIYPAFPKRGATISVIAPSAGIPEERWNGFDLSLERIMENGWKIREFPSVRNGQTEAAPPELRAKELKEAFTDPEISAVWCATGGDLLTTMLEHTDFQTILDNPKWLLGYSDPTHLLFPITTKYDIATIYAGNAGAFDDETPDKSYEYTFSTLKGELPLQRNFETWRKKHSEDPDTRYPVYWETPNGPFHQKGRLIGGCLECLSDLIGTKYDGMKDFLSRYRNDGILWYFDVFSRPAEELYLALWHMKEAGWFEGAVGFLFGRVCFPATFIDMSYREAVRRALGDMPLILEADIGHVSPRMTLINGAVVTVDCENGKASLKTELK